MSTPTSESFCVFCGIVAGDIPSTRVGESDRAVAFMDLSPATPGHLLVVPRAHSANIHEVEPGDLVGTALLAKEMAGLVAERLGADGVNLFQSNGATAWQTVFHLHMHVIPRYADDPLVLPWQPTAGDSDQIAAAAAKLRGE